MTIRWLLPFDWVDVLADEKENFQMAGCFLVNMCLQPQERNFQRNECFATKINFALTTLYLIYLIVIRWKRRKRISIRVSLAIKQVGVLYILESSVYKLFI